MTTVTLELNGKTVTRSVNARKHLTDFLREDCELTGSHVGCEHGVCGACSVRLNGQVVRGCLTLAAQADGQSVETIEGASDRGDLADLQAEFIKRNAAQCAFCSSGMLLTAAELVAAGKPQTREEIREHMSGNFCRCTGYHAIIDAVEAVNNARLQGASS
ncbi:(2Fe-2S)-binding protein (plasmid) [Leisingera sp. M527]|uniref:(2Fe-2S)-binding protein n=1 Tax=Leisingera sp. M527 TaxID=2867014 RepID=UPI0021A76905|nr:(2Fe-2S)-binding protein [Leisingera sp. M527]UWQ35440.1 (2Fe-2S)-binding protein [Leisingera sp. M527]